MRMMIPSIFKTPLLAGIISLSLACCFNPDEISRTYATLAEAEEDVVKGWLPNCLPPSTHTLSDTHDLDTNIGKGSFQFAPHDFTSFQQHPPVTESGLASRHPASREWTSLKKAGYHFLTIPEFILAVHPSGKGRYWMNSK
jgi:hypothetical protein